MENAVEIQAMAKCFHSFLSLQKHEENVFSLS